MEQRKRSPFDYVNSVSFNKQYIYDVDDNQYVPFIINKALSYFSDTIFYADEINRRSFLENSHQYDYYFYTLPPKKRYGGKWIKSEDNEDVRLVQEEYGYSKERAIEALKLLNQSQIQYLRDKYAKRN